MTGAQDCFRTLWPFAFYYPQDSVHELSTNKRAMVLGNLSFSDDVTLMVLWISLEFLLVIITVNFRSI